MRAIAIYLQIKVVADGSYETAHDTVSPLGHIAFSQECNAYNRIKAQ
jgi:hypothetical protein